MDGVNCCPWHVNFKIFQFRFVLLFHPSVDNGEITLHYVFECVLSLAVTTRPRLSTSASTRDPRSTGVSRPRRRGRAAREVLNELLWQVYPQFLIRKSIGGTTSGCAPLGWVNQKSQSISCLNAICNVIPPSLFYWRKRQSIILSKDYIVCKPWNCVTHELTLKQKLAS